MDATISPYCTLATRFTAATIGRVACPPQVTILTFGASRFDSPFTGGIVQGRIAAGVSSMPRLQCAIRISLERLCTTAEAECNTQVMAGKPGIATSKSEALAGGAPPDL